MPGSSTYRPEFISYMHAVEAGEKHRDPKTGLWMPYNNDGAGKWTIGRGHLINGGRSPAGFENGLTDEEVNQLFQDDLDDAAAAVRRQIGGKVYDHLSDRQREMLIDFEFNVGNVSKEFPAFTEAVLRNDMRAAVVEAVRKRKPGAGADHIAMRDRNDKFYKRYFGVDISGVSLEELTAMDSAGPQRATSRAHMEAIFDAAHQKPTGP